MKSVSETARPQVAQPGPNRTVRETPDYVERMVEGTEEFGPTSNGDAEDIAAVRVEYAQRSEPIGSIPMHGLDVNDPELAMLVDKLGERLAFERTGVRLYDGLVSKHRAYGGFDGGPELEELQRFREEELEHMRVLTRAMEQIGADPTAFTPSADIAATIGMGLPAVISDPRTTLLQSLEAIVVAELADNECWDALAELTEAAGLDELAEEFREAQSKEEEHLAFVRAWIAAGQGRALDVSDELDDEEEEDEDSEDEEDDEDEDADEEQDESDDEEEDEED